LAGVKRRFQKMLIARRIQPTVAETAASLAKRLHKRIEAKLDRVEWDTLMCRVIGHTRPWQASARAAFICRRCKRAFGGVRL